MTFVMLSQARDHYYYSIVRRKGRDFDKVVTKVTLISAQVSPTLSKEKKTICLIM